MKKIFFTFDAKYSFYLATEIRIYFTHSCNNLFHYSHMSQKLLFSVEFAISIISGNICAIV